MSASTPVKNNDFYRGRENHHHREREKRHGGEGREGYTPAPSRPCSVLICCLSRRVSKQARAVGDQGGSRKAALPKRGTLQTQAQLARRPYNRKSGHGTGLGGRAYNLVTTLAGLDVADFTHRVQERRGLRIGRGFEEETKRGGGVVVVRGGRIVCVCERLRVVVPVCTLLGGCHTNSHSVCGTSEIKSCVNHTKMKTSTPELLKPSYVSQPTRARQQSKVIDGREPVHLTVDVPRT
jgi:hypothetical protein